ncbi:MAG: hypothetical protein GX295_06255 [Syntrophomonadaceae bacterium]|nr:hypothetical protein [Syntrophomonadaceae bacterium]
MRVQVEIVTSLLVDVPSSYSTELEVEAGTLLFQLGERMGVPDELNHLALVNGEIRSGDYVLQEGDYIAFYTQLNEAIEDLPLVSLPPLPS